MVRPCCLSWWGASAPQAGECIDGRELKVGDTVVLPFVFDKALARSPALGDALVTDAERLRAAIRAVGDDNVASSNEVMSGLYHPTAVRQWIEINGQWTDPLFGESPRRRDLVLPDAVTSTQVAFDLLVVYARSLTRDVPLSQWETHPTTVALAEALNGIYLAHPDSIAPLMPLTSGGGITARDLFRGVFVGEECGFFWNQFQMFPSQGGLRNTPQPCVHYPERDARAQVTKQGFLDQQEGRLGFQKLVDPEWGVRIIATPRDVIGCMHSDVLETTFDEAVDVLLRTPIQRQSIFDGKNQGLASGTGLFYSEAGDAFARGALKGVVRSSLVAAWVSKYAFFRIRPEKLAYYWNLVLKGELQGAALSAGEEKLKAALLRSGYLDEHLEILNSPGGREIMRMVRENNEACNLADPDDPSSSSSEPYMLMPLYPEGSPTHPSFVGGHSVATGAQATVIKMVFNMYREDGKTFKRWSEVIARAYEDSFSEDAIKALWADSDFIGKFYTTDASGDLRAALRPDDGPRPEKYVVDASAEAMDITVVGEIHKLASQFTYSRDWAGVHYATDGYFGMYIGQSVAIRYMQQVLQGLPSRGQRLDNSITFPTFDGKKVTITAGDIVWEGRRVARPELLYPEEVATRLVQPPSAPRHC